MGKSNGYRIEPFGGNRQMVAAASTVNHEQNTIHLITEVDITAPRHLIAAYRARTGERLSLTAYIVTCLARTLAEFPRFNAFRRGNRLIVLDDITINVLFEREIDGETVPEAVGIQAANRQSYRQIHAALREIQQEESQHLGSASGMGWIRFIPGFLLRTFVRLASRSITMQKRFGVVAVTAVGMFGAGALWLVPLTSATVTVAVGSIVKRPAFIDSNLMEREYLCLTLSFNHDIVDGAPAARFTARFAELLRCGEEIGELINCTSGERTCRTDCYVSPLPC